MSKHSSLVGGSNAGRILNCPASFQATLALPPSVDISSEYAEEGSFAHEVMSWIMKGASGPNSGILQGSIGIHVYDRVVTRAHVDEMLQPALDAFNDLLAEYGFAYDATDWPHENVEVERRVAFPGIPGAFGTCDVLMRCGDHVFLVDWKFGAGVPVEAVYRDPEGDLINPQLMFYATAAMASARHIFKGAKVLVAAIIQPRSAKPLTHTTITRREIRWFREDLQTAVVEATSRNPRIARGEHCRFAPCKVSCPLWTGAVLDLSALGIAPPAPLEPNAEYGQYLAKAKALVDVFAMFSKEVNDQLHSFLENGGKVPGWRLKAKTKQRKWIDEDTVEEELTKLGLSTDEIWRTELNTFAAVDAAAKRRGIKVPEHLRVAPPTNETTIATTDDPAPVVEPKLVLEQFRASLALLQQKTS